MNCPNCNSALSEIKSETLGYYQCPNCEGIFAKGKVLAGLLYSLEKDVKPENSKNFESIKVNLVYSLTEKGLDCPSCSSKMEKFNYAYDSNVFADKCPKCQYIWLNKGELEKIASRISPNPYYRKLGSLMSNMMNIGKTNTVVDKDSALPLFSLSSILIGDETKPYRFPFITISLIIFNAILMSLLMILFLSPDTSLGVFLLGFGNKISYPDLSIGVTELFIIQLIFNSLLLWVFGDNLEDSFGHFGFMFFYIFVWVSLSILFTLVTDSVMVMVGYSAALSALMGAYYVLYPDVKLKIYSFFSDTVYKVNAKGSLMFFISQQVFSILMYGKNYRFGYIIQIIGFLIGYLVSILLKKLNLVRIIKNFSEFD